MTDSLIETRLGERVRVWTLGGERLESSYGANCVGIAGEDAIALVDPLIAPAHARLVEDTVRSWTDRPVLFIVLTHHHTDHALGAGWFASRGAVVVAHPACRAAMAAEHPALVEARRKTPALSGLFRDAEPYVPSVVFAQAEWTADLGGVRVRARHFGPGHTPGDLVVSVDEESVTVCGDLVSVRYHVNYEDAALDRLAGGLEALRALGTATYVPGHGAVGGREILEHQLSYHREVAEAASGGNPAEGVERLRARYPGYLLEELLPQSIARWGKRKEA